MDVQAERPPLSPFCFCTTVSAKGLAALIEAGDSGAYRDDHPWLAAKALFESERAAGRTMAILFATGAPIELSHWAILTNVDVVELHRGRYESRCDFGHLRPVHPLWTALDSVTLKPGDDQIEREALEPLPVLRHPLDERHAHPYAICETPAFMLVKGGGSEATETSPS